jgi:PAS domain S-box-containing protein
MSETQILIVEDERIVAEDLRESLQSMGYTVASVVSSGIMAIKKVKELKPEIVLMDIELKGKMDGIEASRQIRSLSNIPVVYLTAYCDDTILDRAKITEPFGYIMKPFREIDLRINIEIALYKHKIEKELMESKEWFSTTLNSLGDAVIATDPKGNVVFMNPIAQFLTGWNMKDAMGKPLNEVYCIVNEETNERIENPVKNPKLGGIVTDQVDQNVLIDKYGTELPVEDKRNPIKDDQGNIIGSVLVFHDIFESIQAEKALRESEEKYRTLFESLQDGVFIIQDGRFNFCNEAFARIGGYTTKEVIGKDFREFVVPEDIELVVNNFGRCQAGKQIPMKSEFHILGKNKKTKATANITAGLITYSGREVIMGTLRELTRRENNDRSFGTIK